MLSIDREIPGTFRLGEAVLHNTAQTLQREPLRVRTPPEPWAYSVAFEAQRAAFESTDGNDLIVVELDLEVEEGEIGVGPLTEDLQEFIGPETNVTAATGRTLARVVISDLDRFFWLMIRNGSVAGRSAVFCVYDVRGYTAREERSADLFEVPNPELQNLLVSETCASNLIRRNEPFRRCRE
jgi:hypothetical protein